MAESALPVKQALVRMRYGQEAATSKEAQEWLARSEEMYVVALEHLPPAMLRGDVARLRAMLLRTTVLVRKGKEPIQAKELHMGNMGKSAIIHFAFPRTERIALEDKEVEFASRVGPREFKKMFRLKDMAYRSKLEL